MTNEEDKLKNYLAKSVQDGDLEQIVADWAMQVWQSLPKTMSMPDAAATPDGCLLFTWNNGVHHLEIEVFPSGYEGMTELFYLNRETDERIDTDYTVGEPMPNEFTAKFNLFPLTDAELDAKISQLEAAADLGALLILQDEQPDWPKRQRVLHAIWRLYERIKAVRP